MAYQRQPMEEKDVPPPPRPRPAPLAAAPASPGAAAAEPRASWRDRLAGLTAGWRRVNHEPEPRTLEYAGLLSYLRASIHRPVPTVVIAGAAAGNGTSRVADGLAEAARASGLRLFFAELGGTPGRPILQQRRVASLPPLRGDRRLTAGKPDGHEGAAPPQEGSARGSNGQPAQPAGPAPAAAGTGGMGAAAAETSATGAAAPAQSSGTALTAPAVGGAGELERWFDRTGSVDFILVEAPPLDSAADAALLARACDGLMLVVQSEVTPRDSLRRSIRLAEASGCRVLGLVMSEPREALPGWIRRLVRGVSPDRPGRFGGSANFVGPAS